MKFSELEYRRPDVARIEEDYKALIERVKKAETDEEILDIWAAHQRLSTEFNLSDRTVYIRNTMNTKDEFYLGEKAYFNSVSPSYYNTQNQLYKALLEHPRLQVLADKFGSILPKKMQVALDAADESVIDLQREDNALVQEYDELYASYMVEFEGKQMTLPQLAIYMMGGKDSATRRAARETDGKWFDEHHEKLDDIFSRMIQNRNEQAKRMGYRDYSELSYLRMGRIGYNMKDIENYREQVARDLVPVAKQLMDLRMQRVGIENPKLYDLDICFKDGNPEPAGDSDYMLAMCKKMYDELSPETQEFIDWMFENESFDVLTKPGKLLGAYMYNVSGYGPFVFANWNGSAFDVDTITHEMGHAFQGYVGNKLGLTLELVEPAMETCEIHSTSMEFLTSPFHHLFFGKDTAKYQLQHAEDALVATCYGCQVDEFQHIVYQKPELTPAERNQVWLELDKKYRPWIDNDGLPFYADGGAWQKQKHIYEFPFYFIDYCLARTAALQFFALHLKDSKEAWKRYVELVKKGGSETYSDLLQQAGFRNPFGEGSMKEIAETLATWCKENQV
ncbi:M3 family oligoendopeptidase [Stomatobaculum longum]|uniref:M3 family oligoendopeptidase n=1 Tax=Stomatobaculum longum TaxID=796942 RepID=UPI0028E5E1FC|nr:M3 family oligoendopeptidase [Stomatobaculum longum]